METSEELVLIILLYFLILALAVIGNCLLIKFIKKTKRKQLKNKFIVTFAYSDILMSLIFLPTNLLLHIIKIDKSDFLCKFNYFVISMTTMLPAQLQLLIAITHYNYATSKMKCFLTNHRTNLTIGLVLFVALSFAFLEFFSVGIEHKGY